MNVGAVILSKTSNVELYGHTMRTLMSLENSVNDSINGIFLDTVIVESDKTHKQQGFEYPNDFCHVICPDEQFGYNKFLNYGLDFLNSSTLDWVIISNNDVAYKRDWFKKLLEFSSNHPEFDSLSPYEPNWHPKRGIRPGFGFLEGYRPAFAITGWCLVMKSFVISKCKLFDPAFLYWYQDNDYALSLQHYGVRHALVESAQAFHTISASLKEIPEQQLNSMTDNQIKVLKNKWGENV